MFGLGSGMSHTPIPPSSIYCYVVQNIHLSGLALCALRPDDHDFHSSRCISLRQCPSNPSLILHLITTNNTQETSLSIFLILPDSTTQSTLVYVRLPMPLSPNKLSPSESRNDGCGPTATFLSSRSSSPSSTSYTASLSGESSLSPSPSPSRSPCLSLDSARCSRCRRSVSVDNQSLGEANGVSYAVNSFYCRRCAEMVGYYKR